MIIFLETSAWIKYFIAEEGTFEIQKFISEKSNSERNTFTTSAITYAEMCATLKRAFNGNRISKNEYKQILTGFEEQWDNVDIPLVNRALIEKSGNLASKYSLKGSDAFQLASALVIDADVFVNSDKELRNAATHSKLLVWNPSDGDFTSDMN